MPTFIWNWKGKIEGVTGFVLNVRSCYLGLGLSSDVLRYSWVQLWSYLRVCIIILQLIVNRVLKLLSVIISYYHYYPSKRTIKIILQHWLAQQLANWKCFLFIAIETSWNIVRMSVKMAKFIQKSYFERTHFVQKEGSTEKVELPGKADLAQSSRLRGNVA